MHMHVYIYTGIHITGTHVCTCAHIKEKYLHKAAASNSTSTDS